MLVVFLSTCHVLLDKLVGIHLSLGELLSYLVALLLHLVASLVNNLSKLCGMIVLFECFNLL